MRLSILLLFILSPICVSGQNRVRIKGKINSGPDREVQFFVWNNYLEYKPTILSKTTTDADGCFAVSFNVAKAQPVQMSYGAEFSMNIWIEPDDSMFINVVRQMKTTNGGEEPGFDKGHVIFSGAHASINNFLFDAGLSIYDSKTHLAAKKRSLRQYNIFLDSMENARLIQKKVNLPDALSSEAEEYIFGEVVSSTFANKAMSPVYKRDMDHQDTLDLNSPGYDDFWKNWKFLSDRALISWGYRYGLSNYFEGKLSLHGKVTNDEMRERYFSEAYTAAHRELVSLPETREYMTAFYLYHMLSFVTRKDSAMVLASRFYRDFPDSHYWPVIEKKMRMKSKVAVAAPEIIAFDTNGQRVSLRELKGKVVYVDVWGSWCGPCIQEFKNSVKLMEKFKDKEVSFVYLNIDDTDEAWKKAILRNHLKGYHLRADKKTGDKIKETYGISFFPYYILIDRNGMLVSNNAKRPLKIEQDILKLLSTPIEN